MVYLAYTFVFSFAVAHQFGAGYLPGVAVCVFFMLMSMLLFEVNQVVQELKALNAKFIITIKKDAADSEEKD